jgi:hypothetical protein
MEIEFLQHKYTLKVISAKDTSCLGPLHILCLLAIYQIGKLYER